MENIIKRFAFSFRFGFFLQYSENKGRIIIFPSFLVSRSLLDFVAPTRTRFSIVFENIFLIFQTHRFDKLHISCEMRIQP